MQGPAGFWPERPLVTAEFSSPLESQLWLQKGPLTLLTAVWAPRVLTVLFTYPSMQAGSLRALGRPRLVLGTEAGLWLAGCGRGWQSGPLAWIWGRDLRARSDPQAHLSRCLEKTGAWGVREPLLPGVGPGSCDLGLAAPFLVLALLSRQL